MIPSAYSYVLNRSPDWIAFRIHENLSTRREWQNSKTSLSSGYPVQDTHFIDMNMWNILNIPHGTDDGIMAMIDCGGSDDENRNTRLNL